MVDANEETSFLKKYVDVKFQNLECLWEGLEFLKNCSDRVFETVESASKSINFTFETIKKIQSGFLSDMAELKNQQTITNETVARMEAMLLEMHSATVNENVKEDKTEIDNESSKSRQRFINVKRKITVAKVADDVEHINKQQTNQNVVKERNKSRRKVGPTMTVDEAEETPNLTDPDNEKPKVRRKVKGKITVAMIADDLEQMDELPQQTDPVNEKIKVQRKMTVAKLAKDLEQIDELSQQTDMAMEKTKARRRIKRMLTTAKDLVPIDKLSKQTDPGNEVTQAQRKVKRKVTVAKVANDLEEMDELQQQTDRNMVNETTKARRKAKRKATFGEVEKETEQMDKLLQKSDQSDIGNTSTATSRRRVSLKLNRKGNVRLPKTRKIKKIAKTVNDADGLVYNSDISRKAPGRKNHSNNPIEETSTLDDNQVETAVEIVIMDSNK